jgi:glycosyltransferase involved in cell wall biosynthesis
MARGKVRCENVVSILHGSEVLRFERNPFWRMLAKKFYRQVKRVITVSEFSRELIHKSFLGEIVKEITIAPGAASTVSKRQTALTERDGKIRVLTLARLHSRKGQLDTALALGQLPVDLRGRVIYQVGGAGDEKYLSEVESACRSHGVSFEYLGEVEPEQLASVYERCDIYAMTSRTLPRSVEGLGITYLEAGFHGKPVVGYRTGGAAEAVVDGETGLLVEEGHTGALAKVFGQLIGAENLRARLGANGKIHSARFDWNTTAEIISRAAVLQLP